MVFLFSGSVSDGALKAVVSSATSLPSEAISPVEERMEQARQLASRANDLICGSCDAPVLHAAFKLTAGVLNQALSYDICVPPLACIGPFAGELDTLVMDVLHSIVGSGWTDDTEALLRLARSHGGCGIPAVADRAHTAFLGAVLRCPPAVTDAPTAW